MTPAFYQSLLMEMDIGVYFVDLDRKITFWNRGAERISGFFAEDMVGRFCYDNILNHIDDKGNRLCLSLCPLQKTSEDGIIRQANVYMHHKDGHCVPIQVKSVQIKEDDTVLGAVEIFYDNSEYNSLKKQNESLATQALHDQLTGLPNRRYLESFLVSKINEFNLLHINFGLIYLDIDRFKTVNDSYVHEVGDMVLKMVANSLKASLRASDIIARLGGEEFVAVVLVDDRNELKEIADKMRIIIANSYISPAKKQIAVTISLGATMVKWNDTLNQILDRSDQLMLQAKAMGRNQTVVD